jgi:hypothetical protein
MDLTKITRWRDVRSVQYLFPSVSLRRKNILAMSKPIPTENWSQQDFLAFLMLYACEANANTTGEACNWIQSRVGEQAFQTAYDAFNQESDYEMIETIVGLKNRFFPGEDGKGQIHKHLVDLFRSDGKFTAMEQHVLHELERLF